MCALQLRIAQIKRQQSTHIIVVPKLFTHLWRKQLHKASDVVIEIPAGAEGWPVAMFESLIIGFVFPHLKCRPWVLQRTPKMFQMARQVRSLFKENKMATRFILSKFWDQVGSFYTMQPNMVFNLLHFQSSSKVSRQFADGGTNKKQKLK